MNWERWGRVSKWVAIPATTFFLLMMLLGLYLGFSGQQEFTFSNQPDETLESEQ
ncbi:MAG: hypothetical protein HOL48_06620 [Porticoccaceae bacterium]|jgi:hypothetical protein|nr:hypothetical protein [Porticoccaceae bacterium]